MYILLKLDYAKFGVFNLFFQKLSKKNFWGSARAPLVKEGLSRDGPITNISPSHAKGGFEPTPLMFFVNNVCEDKAIETKFRQILHY